MTATLTINFEDGTSKNIILLKAIEIDISPEQKQSIEFRETKSGSWIMSYTKPILEGKKLKNISLEKNS